MTSLHQMENIAEVVGEVMKNYQKQAWQIIGNEGGVNVGPIARSGHVNAYATLHAAAVQALARVEAAQIQAAAIDRLTAALLVQKPRRSRCLANKD
ncbi:hypothetical protein [Malikia spinosa]|uniref:Uncharacterized protein n=1 Tax=Malikia spinosa TaxID=86180 RepID=A0A7C9MQT4_9BURK|nr:hypothetical protein [Malikia spinosa]MYZ51178.1 hypothetical protein [Malikia spinosa]